jgi:hypothetical protein
LAKRAKFLGHLFEQGDAAPVGLDQVVVGGQERGDFALSVRVRRKDNLDLVNVIPIQRRI